MTTDVIHEVRRIAPPVSKASELSRARQRGKLADAISAESRFPGGVGSSAPVAAVAPSRSGRGSGRRLHMVGAAAAIAAAITAAAVPISLRSATRPTVRVVKRASAVMVLDVYRLRLPSDYRLVGTTTSACTPPGVGFSSPAPGPPRTEASSANVPGYASHAEAAANADGGCISMVLAPPYTPTATNPDPEAGTFEDEPPIQVGRYEGRAGAWYSVSKPSDVRTEQWSLYVQIPIAGVQMQDLVVSANGLSERDLIAVVANGLTVAPSA